MKNYHEINNIFWNYVLKFDTQNPHIFQKLVHTFTVANNCFDASCSLNFNEEDREFCYIMGVFHDIGRFEQWSKFQTFDDNISKNHGDIGRKVLIEEFTPEILNLSKEKFDLLADTIQFHVREFKGDNKELWKYLEIIHSADAYSNVLNTAFGEHDLSSFENGCSEEFISKFFNNEKLYKYSVYTKLERLLKSIANVYCISIDFMIKEIILKNYFNIIYNTYERQLIKEDKAILRKAIEHLINKYKLD